MNSRWQCENSFCKLDHFAVSKVRTMLFLSMLFSILMVSEWKVWGQGSVQGGVRYEAVDVMDEKVGEDLWEYSYEISGYEFQAGQGFSVFFDPQLYGGLQNPRPSLSPLWDMIVVQSDPLLQAPGYLDGQARVNSPSTAIPFQVTFVWLGQGTPGGQPFEFYGSDFQTLYSGASVVPEPQSFLLAGVGGLMILGWRRWGRKE